MEVLICGFYFKRVGQCLCNGVNGRALLSLYARMMRTIESSGNHPEAYEVIVGSFWNHHHGTF